MNLALQRRRLLIAMAVTAAAAIAALAAIAASYALHAAWGAWVFVAALVVGFGSHGWLIWGVVREKSAP